MLTTPLQKTLLAAALTLLANSAIAAEPVKSRYVQDVVKGDQIYSHYVVHCSNGAKVNISAWNNRSKWCVGKGQQNICGKNQLRIAKRVCRQAGKR